MANDNMSTNIMKYESVFSITLSEARALNPLLLQHLNCHENSFRSILRSVKNLRPASFSRSQLRLARLASFHETGAQRGFDEWIFTINHLCQEVSHGFTVLSPRSWNKINLLKPTTQIYNRAQNRPEIVWLSLRIHEGEFWWVLSFGHSTVCLPASQQ